MERKLGAAELREGVGGAGGPSMNLREAEAHFRCYFGRCFVCSGSQNYRFDRVHSGRIQTQCFHKVGPELKSSEEMTVISNTFPPSNPD